MHFLILVVLDRFLILVSSSQLYPFIVLMGGVLVWYDSTWYIIYYIINFWPTCCSLFRTFHLLQGLSVSIWHNGKISSFSCAGNRTCIWVSCGKIMCVFVFKYLVCAYVYDSIEFFLVIIKSLSDVQEMLLDMDWVPFEFFQIYLI